jgi:flagellar transcriptional activator FlhD
VSQILCSFRFNDHTVLSALTYSQVEAAAMTRTSSGTASSHAEVGTHQA